MIDMIDYRYNIALNIYQALTGDKTTKFENADQIWAKNNEILKGSGKTLDIEPFTVNIDANGVYDFGDLTDNVVYDPISITVDVPNQGETSATLTAITINQNGQYYAWQYNADGFDSVSVNVEGESGGSKPLPYCEVISYESNIEMGVEYDMIIRVHNWNTFRNGYLSGWGSDLDINFSDPRDVIDNPDGSRDYIISYKAAGFNPTCNIDGFFFYDTTSWKSYKQDSYVYISFTVSGDFIKADDPDVEINLDGWGNPENAIKLDSLMDFRNADGYAADQWFEISGICKAQHQNETGCIQIWDESLGEDDWSLNTRILINYMNGHGPSAPEWHYNNYNGVSISDGNLLTIRTLRWKVDTTVLAVNEALSPNQVFGGHCYDSPVAILVDVV